MATNRHIGFGGYKVSPDHRYLLVARWLEPAPNELLAIRLDDAVETVLATDLLLYQLNMIGPAAFAFTHGGTRVVYVNHQYGGTSSVPIGGGAPTRLSMGNGFAVSPSDDYVAILEASSNTPGATLNVSEASGSWSYGYNSNDSISAVTFAPAHRGLLFVETTTAGPRRLRHWSLRGGDPTDLATWRNSNLDLHQFALGEMQPVYPVDPTGCYVVVDSDASGAEGVSIALVPQ
jgi:hypothetical protein